MVILLSLILLIVVLLLVLEIRRSGGIRSLYGELLLSWYGVSSTAKSSSTRTKGVRRPATSKRSARRSSANKDAAA